jgi:hypothetical protein
LILCIFILDLDIGILVNKFFTDFMFLSDFF